VATKLNAILEFPADATAVFAMFSAPTYLDMKCAQSAQGSFNITDSESGLLICVERSLDDIPETYRKFLGSDLMIKEVQTWHIDNASRFYADLKISIDAKPILLSATLNLTSTQSGSQLIFDGEVVVSIPLFGAMAENFISEHFSAVIALEHTIGLQWLSAHK